MLIITQSFVHDRIKEIHWFNELTLVNELLRFVIWKFFEFTNRASASLEEMDNYFLKYRLLQFEQEEEVAWKCCGSTAVKLPLHTLLSQIEIFSRRVPCSHAAKFGSPFQSLGQRLNQLKKQHSNSSLWSGFLQLAKFPSSVCPECVRSINGDCSVFACVSSPN